MATKLYVGSLPYSTTDESLMSAFSQAGTVVSAKIIIDKMTGRSKGFAFVEMESEEEAQNAIQMFHGKEFEGRTLIVNEARPLEERPPRRSFEPRRSGGYDRGGSSSGYSDRGSSFSR